MERPLVTGIAHSTDDARLTLTGVPDKPGIAGRIFSALADADINVDMIIQNEPVSPVHRAELSFTLPKADLVTARRTLEGLAGELGLENVVADGEMGTVSLIGAGMRSHPGVAAKVFQTLGERAINIEMISTSPIKISCAIRADRVPEAVQVLHDAFGLSGDSSKSQEEAA